MCITGYCPHFSFKNSHPVMTFSAVDRSYVRLNKCNRCLRNAQIMAIFSDFQNKARNGDVSEKNAGKKPKCRISERLWDE